jgi:hypothetical protein
VTERSTRDMRPVEPLPEGLHSLARLQSDGLPPGTLFVLSVHGGMRVLPDSNFTLRFGRDDTDRAHVCVGRGDDAVSREHGFFRHDGRRWRLHNVGRLPIALPGGQLLLTGHDEPMPAAYTPLFIRTDLGREHLLEVRVTRREAPPPPSVPASQETRAPRVFALDERDRLMLVVLGQRYLRHEIDPQPLTWAEAVRELSAARPAERWTDRILQHRVREVRLQLSARGVWGLVESEVPPPLGNALNHNLIMALLSSATIVPPDLRLLRRSGSA